MLAKDPDCEGSGAHHCSTTIPQLSAAAGRGHRVPLVQVWGSHHQKHAVMLQPLPQSIVCCISHPNLLFTDTVFLLYVSWPKLQNYMGSYSSILENIVPCIRVR